MARRGKRRRLTPAQIKAGFGGKAAKRRAGRRRRRRHGKEEGLTKRRRRGSLKRRKRTRVRARRRSHSKETVHMARKRRKGGRRRRRHSREETPRRRRRRRRARSNEAPRRRRRRGGRRRRARETKHAAAPRRRRRRGGRRRRRAREYPGQVRRTRRGRFTSRRRAGKYHTKLVGRITGERRRRRSSRRRGAMENPLGGMEIVVGLLTGTLGFATADVLDRLVTMRERKDDKGQPIAGGMRFIEAPLIDDFFPRVGTAVAVAAVPLVAAQFIASPMGRSALQFFGFGAAFRLLGKAVDDVAAYLFKDSAVDSTGKKLFSGEIGQRTAVGLSGVPCPNCGNKAGLGACACRSMLPQYGGMNLPIQPSPVSSTIPPGGGYPPVVNQGPPPVFMPPERPVVPVVPPPAISRGPGPAVPTTPPPTSPPTSMFAPNLPNISAPRTLNGLGDVSAATEVLRSHGPAYVALRRNRSALSAAANGTATPAQRQTADSVVSQHRSSFATLQQFHPTVLDTAARGLGMLVDEPQRTTFPGTSRHRDQAAE